MNTTLASNLEIIFKHFMVDEVFLWTYRRHGIVQHIVQVHTHNKQRSRTLPERCERLLTKMDDHQFVFYNTREVQSRINNGHGRLYLNCVASNRIYLNPTHKNTVVLPELTATALTEQSTAYIKQEKDKILSFIDGYHLYINRNNYPNAAFMLHQALEIAFRMAQKLLIGIERRSHSLQQNIDFFKPFDSYLSTLCPDKEGEKAINKLTESYTGSRYRQNFEIDIDKIKFCKDIADRILSWIETYELELLQEIQDKLSSPQGAALQSERIKTNINNMEKKTNISHDHRDLIHNALETYGQVHGLYCFAYVTRQDSMCNLLNVQQSHNEVHHYYLFVIMSNQHKPIVDLQNCVMQLLPEKIKLTLIQETAEQVEKKLKKGDAFRTNLLQSAECWYKDREFIGGETESQTIDLEKSRREWDQRYLNAMDLNFASAECSNDINRETQAYLSAMTIEQICLGVITLFLGYTPVTSNLNYLMNLCDIICPDITIIFHREDTTQKRQFNLLIEAQNKYRHSPRYSAKDICLENLNEQILSFFEEIGDFVEAYFERQQPEGLINTENIEKCA